MNWRQLAVITGLSLLALLFSFSNSVRSSLSQLATPVSPVSTMVVKVRNWFGAFSKVSSLRIDLEETKAENQQLLAQLTEAKEEVILSRELEREFKSFSDQEHQVIGRVIRFSPSALAPGMSIDVGEVDGIQVGQPVRSNGFLVGLVNKVGKTTSSVILVTNARVKIPVMLQESRAQGILEGGIQGLVMTDVPIDVEIKPEEMIVTSSLGERIVAGIPVGRAGEIVSTDSEVLQRLMVDSPVNTSKLEIVSVDTRSPASLDYDN